MEGSPNDLLWKRLAMHIDMFKFYMEGVLKLLGFYFAITGGVLSYVLSRTDTFVVKWALLLPVLLAVGLVLYFNIGNRVLQKSLMEVEDLRASLQLPSVPKVALLSTLLIISMVILAVTAVGVVIAICMI